MLARACRYGFLVCWYVREKVCVCVCMYIPTHISFKETLSLIECGLGCVEECLNVYKRQRIFEYVVDLVICY